jgi:hypothetical protein
MGGVGGSSKAKRPIGVKFEIPYFTTSGIQVRYLKIIEPKVSMYRIACPFSVVCWFTDSLLCSYNTHHYLGCGILRRAVILLCDYLICKRHEVFLLGA